MAHCNCTNNTICIDKYVDVMDLNKNYVICIFMNINENDENQDLQRDNLLPFEGFRVGYL